MKKKIVWLLLSLLFIKLANAQKEDFHVYNAIMIKDKPNLTKYGISSLNMIYDDSLLNKDLKHSSDLNKRTLNLGKLRKELNKININLPICLDIESWTLYPDIYKNSVPKYLSVLNQFKKRYPYTPIGLYGVIPYADAYLYQSYLPLIRKGSKDWQESWNKINDSLTAIALAVDIAYPSCYTRNKDMAQWFAVTKAQINKIKQLNPKLKVYAFIWPQYYAKGYGYLYEPIDSKTWTFELETLYDLCDGIVIWHPSFNLKTRIPYRWDKHAQWWRATRQFIKKHNIKS